MSVVTPIRLKILTCLISEGHSCTYKIDDISESMIRNSPYAYLRIYIYAYAYIESMYKGQRTQYM